MLAYRHAFHAGNHADVLKHTVFASVLRYMNRKDKPYRVIDTHAGAGGYSLDDPFARKTGEFTQGVARLWGRIDLPEPVADYLACVKAFNLSGNLAHYPGSPAFANMLLRPRDELCLFELHPTDFPLLCDAMGERPGIEVRRADGFATLPRRLPPPSRRAVVLMDPSYELISDYTKTTDAVRAGLENFAEGVFLVWYPQINNKPASAELPEALKKLAPKGWLHARLTVQEPFEDGYGMVGSGMFVINPPYTLHEELSQVLPYLTGALAQYAGASHLLEHRPA
jgi:23S rRNA (adenine2030-N6)-methyltransferase